MRDEKWVDVFSCVVSDKDKFFGLYLNVFENYYKSYDFFVFFLFVFNVRIMLFVEDYCVLWKDWERIKERLLNYECCVFWSFFV